MIGLPPPETNQAYCEVSPLEAGLVEIPLEWVIDTAQPGERSELPALSFVLRRPGIDELFLFDLGIRKNWEQITPGYAERAKKLTFRISVPQDAVEALARGGTRPADVGTICISHAHFDHVGDPAAFDRATFVVGADTRGLLAQGYPHDPHASLPADLLPAARTRYLDPADWPPLGPFAHALDFHGDGSLYIVDAPGHLPGHVNVLARTSRDGAWVYLAGDSAHDRRLLTGEAGVPEHGVFGCAHRDKEKATEHLGKIRALMLAEPRMRVILAHDRPWWEENRDKDVFWPNKMDSM
ncbi:hypothetical protein PHLGIDRAFT_290838 [Phlebiopsis gigantea 11061_1 CR5-6]|uniref:Metallo-beta-lactamase domain-containing protein n=1 Tax=Phlebiopsis gigantea (strain 11061_1 CR5-6) TaxID=745531 RepID=A0A0C3NDC7_PHLG1|nr:hypothetical protein PHLGIDRAFT_290838 [Phlebiopsis gigantea 11061_1 CR5-6]